jgi:hypothetical protein
LQPATTYIERYEVATSNVRIQTIEWISNEIRRAVDAYTIDYRPEVHQAQCMHQSTSQDCIAPWRVRSQCIASKANGNAVWYRPNANSTIQQIKSSTHIDTVSNDHTHTHSTTSSAGPGGTACVSMHPFAPPLDNKMSRVAGASEVDDSRAIEQCNAIVVKPSCTMVGSSVWRSASTNGWLDEGSTTYEHVGTTGTMVNRSGGAIVVRVAESSEASYHEKTTNNNNNGQATKERRNKNAQPVPSLTDDIEIVRIPTRTQPYR